MKLGLMWYMMPASDGRNFEMKRGDMEGYEVPEREPANLKAKGTHRREQPHRRPHNPHIVPAQ